MEEDKDFMANGEGASAQADEQARDDAIEAGAADTVKAAEEQANAAAGRDAGAPAESAEEKIAALEAALAVEKDKAVRLYADFENFRRRMERERLETWSRAENDLLSGLLPVIDNFDRAMAQAGDDPFSEGVKMVYASVQDYLKKRDVTAIEAVGKPFDPAIHEAVAYQPSPDAPEGTVIYETRRGYMAGAAVLRPASVIVSSGAPKGE